MSPSAAKTSRGAGLSDTVKPYNRHLIVCTGKSKWKSHLEKSEGLLGRMAKQVRRHDSDDGGRTLLTASDEATVGKGFDVLAYPEGVRYRNVDRATWPHLLAGNRSSELVAEPIDARYVFVCTHKSRDERCGRCGPPIMEALVEACARAGLGDVRIRGTSHVGGHKYAGNVILYPDGVWYGHVRPEDADRIVEKHLMRGEIVEELLRGGMEAR